MARCNLLHGDAVSRPVHDSGVTILNILSIIKDIGWNGGGSVSVQGGNGLTFFDVSAFQCKKLDVYRGLRCQESFSCRAPLRFCKGKSIWSYVYQCFSDCIGNEHKIRMVSAFGIWFEDAFLGSKVAVTMHVLDLTKHSNFLEGE